MHKEYILLNGFRKAKKGFTAGFHVRLIVYSLWIMFLKLSRRFGFSNRSIGHVVFSFAGTAQEVGAGVRWGQLVGLSLFAVN